MLVRQHAKAQSGVTRVVTALLCKIYPPTQPLEGKNPSAAPVLQPVQPSLLAGATLKLSGAPKASANETVVVSLCVESAPGLPEQRQQALKNHLLVKLSAIGLQVDPNEKISPEASTAECLGTAEWTVRANASWALLRSAGAGVDRRPA